MGVGTDADIGLEPLSARLTVCKVAREEDVTLSGSLVFVGKTDEELSLVCETNLVPPAALEREDGWRALWIRGVLDFSLVGILAKLSGVLADAGIGIFAVSTFISDYVLVRDHDFERAKGVLASSGYELA